MSSLSGKNMMITGANSGIGFAASMQLAELGATVIMACRNQERGSEAQKKIIEKTTKINIHFC